MVAVSYFVASLFALDSQQQARHFELNSANIESTAAFSIPRVEEFAKYSGIKISSTVTGPLLRLEAFLIEDGANASPIGYLTAFSRPPGIFHLDTIKVQNRRQNLSKSRRRSAESVSMSFVLGSWALVWARENCGCNVAQLLAVEDTSVMNAILVRLYER